MVVRRVDPTPGPVARSWGSSVALLLRRPVDVWVESRVPKLAAEIAFNRAFAIAPLFLMAIAVMKSDADFHGNPPVLHGVRRIDGFTGVLGRAGKIPHALRHGGTPPRRMPVLGIRRNVPRNIGATCGSPNSAGRAERRSPIFFAGEHPTWLLRLRNARTPQGQGGPDSRHLGKRMIRRRMRLGRANLLASERGVRPARFYGPLWMGDGAPSRGCSFERADLPRRTPTKEVPCPRR
jgi:hypothetical protein